MAFLFLHRSIPVPVVRIGALSSGIAFPIILCLPFFPWLHRLGAPIPAMRPQ
jgi:hypothetical protein|tara:strand:+ start:516 stop:671 length:156 start_codon:yes stop_codon:yes gene_type:complete